tara:strand:+ start:14120 stop:14821 length:702 start_codon:yes stop_codon:yes gene_type:complete
MSRAFVPAHARAPTLAMSIIPRAMTHDFPRIVTDGGVAGAPERRARGAIARASRRHLARASTATTTRATRDGEGETSASARGAMVASCLALAMTLVGVDGEAASAATARGEVFGPVAGTFRENLAREERMVVDEVMRDEQIGIDIIREGATPRERLDMFIEKEPPVAVLFSAMFVVNGCFGLIYTLFIRETSAGPGGEFGKSVVNIRKSIVKGIFTFFNAALGRYTTEDSQDA